MANSEAFPAADVQNELNPSTDKEFHVDPAVSSDVAKTKEIKGQGETEKLKHDRERKDALQSFKAALVVTGIIVAVAGAAFAITKKLRET